ncbi:MAG: Gfo/Idh/MocA family oxidoreductase, partial [Deinococcota bacterium]
MKRWKIAGINFDHQHMGDLLQHVADHPEAEIVGIAHEDRIKMQGVVDTLAITEAHVFTDYQQCLEQTEPDLVILCPATASHADWTEKVAPYGVHVLVEKPFAASVTDAQRMIRALEQTGQQLVINWPLRWYPPHVTSKRLIDEGTIGDVTEVHYYDGNCGPVRHGANKMELEPSAETKAASWFYAKDQGGGSLLDYLGYGVTLGSWFNGGLEPLDVTTIVDKPEGLEVDEHSVSIVRYPTGLSKFETRWGTFSDPWTHQPQPKCGFVMVGTKGTLAS